MENLIKKYESNRNIAKGLKEMNLLEKHPKFKIGQIISFYGGYNADILYKTKIKGFDKDENIYVLWDCYWFPIKDEPKRKIKILE